MTDLQFIRNMKSIIEHNKSFAVKCGNYTEKQSQEDKERLSILNIIEQKILYCNSCIDFNSKDVKPKKKSKKKQNFTINDIKDEEIRLALWRLTNPDLCSYSEYCESFLKILECLINIEWLEEEIDRLS